MVTYVLHPLDPCVARIRRGGEHLDDLKRMFANVEVSQANAIGINFNSQPPYGIESATPPDQTFIGGDIPIRFGEICYNFRSALDYLVFELAKLDSGSEQSGTQFPIMDSVDDFRGNRGKACLKGIHPAHVAAIERLQPYQGCNWTKNLREASNPDKHRHFVKMAGLFNATIHSSTNTDLSKVIGYERDAPHPVLGTVKVKVHVSSHVSLDNGTPVIEALEEIQTQIANTLGYFQSEFQGRHLTPPA